MHRGYRFDVRVGAARRATTPSPSGSTRPYRYAEEQRDRLGDRPNAYPEPFNFIRKMACNFGWDWGPTLVTAGIWQEIGLHAWSTARLGRRPPTGDGRRRPAGRVELHVEVERAADRAADRPRRRSPG